VVTQYIGRRPALPVGLPTLVVLVVQTLVGVVETYFVSFLGTEALAGVALVFPERAPVTAAVTRSLRIW